MISQRSSTKTDSRFSFSGAGRFLLCKVRANWASFLLYACLALIIPIFVLVGIGYADHYERETLLLELAQTELIQIFFTIAAIAAALLSSVYAWRNTHTKIGNYFEHKLPLTRNALFLANSLYGLLLFIVPFLLMMVIFALIGAFTCGAGLYGTFMIELIKLTVYTVVFYVLYYSVFTFSCVVCGNTAVHIAFSLIILFIPFLLSLCFSTAFELLLGWEITDSTLLDILGTSPITLYTRFGVISEIATGKVFLHSLFVIIGAAVIFAIGAVLNIFLKSERAGEAFTYNGIKVTVKYLIIFIIMTLAAILLPEMTAKNAGGIIISALLLILIGFVCNLVLNMVMYRGVRRGVLKGIKAFACVAFVCVVLMAGITVRYHSAPVKISSGICKEIIIYDTTYDTDNYCHAYLVNDKNDIKHLMSILDNSQSGIYGYDDEDHLFNATVIVNTSFGSSLKNSYYRVLSDEEAHFIEGLKNNASVEKALLSVSESCKISIYSQGFISKTFENAKFNKIFREIYLPELQELYGLYPWEYSGKSVYNYFLLKRYDHTIRMPIYSDMEKTRAAIQELYGNKEFPYAPAFSSEVIVESQCKSILISCDINVLGNDGYKSDYYKNIEKKLSSSVPSEKEVLIAILEYLCENEKELQEGYESLIYDEEDTSDPDNKQPIAYVLMFAHINTNVNSTGVETMVSRYIPFNRETAEILGFDYDEIIDDIKA
ncbi:MAG: hypothetical protein ACI3XF_01435, partial [Eubacteriales bacterium]